MIDPRFQDLSELPRRMTATLDLRALSEDLTLRAIEATGAATGAIALWDRTERPARHARRPRGLRRSVRGWTPGETYALLDEYPASRRVLIELPPHQRPRRPGPRTTRPSATGSIAGRTERRAPPAARLARRGHRRDVPRAARGQPSADDDLVYSPAPQRHRRQRDRERRALRRAPVDASRQYRSLIERLPAVTYLDDIETGETQYVSPQITDLFGITPDEWKASAGRLARARPSGRPRAGRCRVPRGDGGATAVSRRVPRRLARRSRPLGGRPHGDPSPGGRPAAL